MSRSTSVANTHISNSSGDNTLLPVEQHGDRSYTSHERRGGVARVPSPSRKAELASSPAELTARITGCSSGEELLSLVEQHSGSFNCIHAAAALAKLAKLSPVGRWKDDARTHKLVARAGELLGDMSGRELANSSWACSKLDITPVWMPRWVELTTHKLGTMISQQLSNSLYALGGLGYHPGDAWLREFYAASLNMSVKNAQDLATNLYSLALLKEAPDSVWMGAFWSASKEEMKEFKPQALSNVIWAAATLGISIPDDWMVFFWEVSKTKMGEFIPQDPSNIIWAAATLGSPPPAGWMTFFWAASRQEMEAFKPQEMSNTFWAAATLGCSPPAEWLARFCDVSREKLTAFNSQNLANTVWAFATLDVPPPTDWLAHFCDVSQEKMIVFKPQDYSNTVWAFAQLRCRPNDVWLRHFFDTSLTKLSDFNNQTLSTILWGFAELDIVPGPEWMAAWETRAAALVDTHNSQDAVSSLWALTALQMQNRDVFRLLLLQAQRLFTPDSNLRVLCSIYDVIQIAAAEKVEGLPTIDENLLEAAKETWNQDLAATAQQRASRNHQAVMVVLSESGVAHKQEYFCLLAGRSIDIALLKQRIAIEVDGPKHYLSTGEPSGTTLLRNRVLRSAGWRVVSIPWFEWRALKSMDEKKAYIKRKIDASPDIVTT